MDWNNVGNGIKEIPLRYTLIPIALFDTRLSHPEHGDNHRTGGFIGNHSQSTSEAIGEAKGCALRGSVDTWLQAL